MITKSLLRSRVIAAQLDSRCHLFSLPLVAAQPRWHSCSTTTSSKSNSSSRTKTKTPPLLLPSATSIRSRNTASTSTSTSISSSAHSPRPQFFLPHIPRSALPVRAYTRAYGNGSSGRNGSGSAHNDSNTRSSSSSSSSDDPRGSGAADSKDAPPNMDPFANYSRPPTDTECLAATVEKPETDNREYRVIRLPNQLEALLIHDPDTDKASAALDVNAGAYSDEDDMPGMAHAVEHLLFMGTKKFPKENEYNTYLSDRSGYSNAFTASLSTNYYFELTATKQIQQEEQEAEAAASSSEVTASKDNATTTTTTEKPLTNGNHAEAAAENDEDAFLYGALDRFAQFFIEPLFLEETLDRELRAVDSENKKNLQSDSWRLNQLLKTLSNPEHPHHGFSTGNLQTLRDEPLARGVAIRDRFIKFHKDHYSANRMKLVVLGRESLDTLQSWVEKLFSDIPNKNLPRNTWYGMPVLTDKELQTEVRTKPVMEMRTLEIQWVYPDEEKLFASRPSGYLSHMIGHEGPGSILAYLKAKGWANELTAGGEPICPGAAFFSVTVRMTEKGLEHYHDIIKTVFQYISILKETPPLEWVFKELRDMSEIDFRFRQKGAASSTTSNLSGSMQKPGVPRDRILSARSVLTEFNPEAVENGLACLNAGNFRLNIIYKDALEGKPVSKEKWYGTEYCVEKISSDFLEELKQAENSSAKDRPSELHLPGKNEFIPSNFEVEKRVVKKPARYPTLIRNDENVRLWYKKDDQFWAPKATISILMRNPEAILTARNGVMSQLYTDLLCDYLSDYAYDAELAGLVYTLEVSYLGMFVGLGGYNDKMPLLLEKVLTTMRDIEFKKERFDILKERLARGYRNWAFNSPYSQVGSFDRWLINQNGFLIEDYYAELDTIELEDVEAFRKILLSQLHIEAFAHGNLHLEDAKKMVDTTEKILRPKKYPVAQWQILRNIELPPGSNYLYTRQLADPSETNHCINYSLQIGLQSDRELCAKLAIWTQMTHEPAFDTLRTKEQLGYIVFSGISMYTTKENFRVLIQSESPPEYLEKRIDAFLAGCEKMLAEMSDEAFEEKRSSVIARKLEKDKNMGEESGRFWNAIGTQYYNFDTVDDDIANLKKVTKQDMMEFYKRYIDPTSPHRAKLAVHMLAQGKATDPKEQTPEEQRTNLATLVEKYLTGTGLDVDTDKLSARFAALDLSKTKEQQTSVVETIKAYLQEDAGMAAEKIETTIQEGRSLLGDALASVGISSAAETGESKSNDLVGNSTTPKAQEPVIITDARTFKATMPLSVGPQPPKDISFYESTTPKL